MDTEYTDLIYNIFNKSLQVDSLPKYIFFICSDNCQYFKNEEISTKRKLLRYVKKLKEQRLTTYLRHSDIFYFDKVFDEKINLELGKLSDDLINLMGVTMKTYLFWLQQLNDKNNLFREITYLLLLKYVSIENDLTKNQILDSISDLAKAYDIKEVDTNFDDLLFNLSEWNENNKRLKDDLTNGLYRIQEVNKILSKQEELSCTNIVYRQITFTGYSTVFYAVENILNNVSLDKFNNEEFIWLFDSFYIGDNLSAIQYNQSRDNETVKYIKFDSKKFRLINSLYPLIHSNDKQKHIYCYISTLNDNKYNHLAVSVILDISLVEFKLTVNSEKEYIEEDEYEVEESNEIAFDNEIINTISRNTPLSISNIIETKLSAIFRIFNVAINDITFIDMLLNDDVMNTYLHLDERVTFWSEKRRLILHMKSIEYTYLNQEDMENMQEMPTELIAMITQVETTRLEKYKLYNSDDVIKFDVGDSYIEINVIRSLSRSSLYRFFDIINKLISYYITNKSGVEKEYLKIFPMLSFEGPKLNKKSRKEKRVPAKAKREELKIYAPDVFLTNFPRLCQKNRQPIVLETDEDVQKHTSQTFRYRDEIRNREVLRYPRDNPIYNFGCDSVKTPFIGVKKSNLPNSDIYPYIPCCFEKPQMDEGTRTGYKDYYIGTKTASTHRTKHRVITDKLLDYGSYGLVNRKLENLFENFTKKELEILRYGVVRSNNSFIHCVMTALKDPYYLSLATQTEKELYIRDVKLNIFNDLQIPLGKQELYDYTEDEILDLVLSDEKFLDPKLVFRYIEEFFDVNIFVFKYKRDFVTSEVIAKLELPRYKLFHSRLIDQSRKSILILKNSDKVSGKVIVNCELLIISSYPDIREAITLFDVEMTSYMTKLFRHVNNVKVWGFEESKLTAFSDDFLYFDFRVSDANNSNIKYLSQFIDDNGKCFGYTMKIDNETLIVMFPPTRPFNLKVGSYDFQFPRYQSVLKIFDNPSSYSLNQDGQVTGLYYQDNTIYFPVEPFNRKELKPDIEEGPEQSYFVKNIKFIEDIHTKRIVVSIILNSIIKLISITKIDNTKQFFDEFIVFSKKNYSYKLDTISFNNLVVISDIETYMGMLQQIVQNLVVNNKLYIYESKLYEDLYYFTSLYIKNITVKYKDWKPNVMNFYKYEENFTLSNFVKVIIGQDKLTNWISYEINNKNKTIFNSVDVDSLEKFTPLVYHDRLNDNFYIIQKCNSLIQGINICNIWYENYINNGIQTTEEEIEGVNYNDYVVYHVDLVGNIEIKESKVFSRLFVLADKYYTMLMMV